MGLVFTFLLVAGLEIAFANNDSTTKTLEVEAPEEPDICTGCNNEIEENKPIPDVTVEVLIDPLTGKVTYAIKGLVIE